MGKLTSKDNSKHLKVQINKTFVQEMRPKDPSRSCSFFLSDITAGHQT